MKKVGQEFILSSYDNGIETYRTAAEELGLWQSETAVIQQYFKKTDQIIDIGCGAGRTTFGMYKRGYNHLAGVDLNPRMVEAALTIAKENQYNILFQIEDATQLSFPDQQFDAALFSFNGLMSIPEKGNRLQAFKEIHRILKKGGTFIFTTHDREADTRFLEFWKEEKEKWEKGENDPRVYDFGDLITHSPDVNREIYIHIPKRSEVIEYLEATKFTLIDDFFRPERYQESESVKAFSGDCRFWIVRKS
ncbi:MAG: class I SAM-dependent methyltransferase [Bacteroidia bacterium]